MNVNPDEIAKFSSAAHDWWNTEGELRTLHQINPLRLSYIERFTTLANKHVIDIGCGGGILTEAMAQKGAKATGLDMSEELVNIARAHAKQNDVSVNYVQQTVESAAKEQAGQYDIVTCMEMLEHVPEPLSIVKACTTLCKPGGHIFFSTINRNAKSFALAIVAAEYILKLVEKGTHHYQEFIQPAELATWARSEQLIVNDVSGIQFNPFTSHHKLNRDTDVNYIMHTQKPS